MKKLLILSAIALFSFSCDNEDNQPNQCEELSAAFFELYDPYKEYLDEYEVLVEQGERTGTEDDRMDYIFNDPQERFKKVNDFADSNMNRCESLKGWGRGHMEPYRQ